MIRRGVSSTQGAALISTILAAALFLLVGTIASQQAVVSFLVSHRVTESAEALVAAETAMAAALADLARQPSFTRLSQADDGPFPFLDGATPPQPLPDSFAVDTRLRSRSQTRIDVIATARGRNRARRILVTTIERENRPFIPAALFLAADTPALSSSGTLEISGSTKDEVSAVATPSQAHVDALASSLTASAAQITGGVNASDWDNLDDLVSRARENALSLPEPPSGAIAPGVWLSRGSVDIADAGGEGVWLVEGDLAVDGVLTFAGLLIVLGDIRVSIGSEIAVRGGIVQAGPGRHFDCDGRAVIDYDLDALNQIDSVHPGLLDRRARVIGWRDEAP